jgi:hypothetical protein
MRFSRAFASRFLPGKDERDLRTLFGCFAESFLADFTVTPRFARRWSIGILGWISLAASSFCFVFAGRDARIVFPFFTFQSPLKESQRAFIPLPAVSNN